MEYPNNIIKFEMILEKHRKEETEWAKDRKVSTR